MEKTGTKLEVVGKTAPRAKAKKPALEPTEFNELVDNLEKESDQLAKLSSQVYSLPKGEKFSLPPTPLFPRFREEIKVGRPELKGLFTQFRNSLDELKSYYKAAVTNKKKTGRTIANKIIMTPALIEFFRGTDLGPAWVKEGEEEEPGSVRRVYTETTVPLLDSLPLLRDYGFAYQSTVSNLFFVYILQRGLTGGKGKGNRYHADEYMLDALGPTFQIISENRLKTSAFNKKGQLKTFDPEDFGMTDFASIIKYNHFLRPEERDLIPGAPVMGPEELRLFKDEELIPRLLEENRISEATKEVWKKRNEDLPRLVDENRV